MMKLLKIFRANSLNNLVLLIRMFIWGIIRSIFLLFT